MEMDEIKETGGARIGTRNATWPFASLIVSGDRLELKANLIGDLIFRPSDIISIEPYSMLYSRGLKLNHRVPAYKKTVIFWTTSDPAFLLSKIEQTGFLSNKGRLSAGQETEIAKAQSQGGFPIKKPAAIVIVVIWNLLILTEGLNLVQGHISLLGMGIGSALGFIILISILILVSGPFRKLIYKEGRTVGDNKYFLYFTIGICSFMLLIFSIMRYKIFFK